MSAFSFFSTVTSKQLTRNKAAKPLKLCSTAKYAFFLFAAVFSQLSKFIADCLPHPILMQGLDFEQANEIVPAH